MPSHKSREVVLRRKAQRRGMMLSRSARRDRLAIGYGLYAILDAQTGQPLTAGHTLTLEEAEIFLDTPRKDVRHNEDE